MTEQELGAIVPRRGLATSPGIRGLDVETYVLLDPLATTMAAPPVDRNSRAVPWDAHDWVVEKASRIRAVVDAEQAL